MSVAHFQFVRDQNQDNWWPEFTKRDKIRHVMWGRRFCGEDADDPPLHIYTFTSHCRCMVKRLHHQAPAAGSSIQLPHKRHARLYSPIDISVGPYPTSDTERIRCMITPFQLLGPVNRYSASYRELVSRSDTFDEEMHRDSWREQHDRGLLQARHRLPSARHCSMVDYA